MLVIISYFTVCSWMTYCVIFQMYIPIFKCFVFVQKSVHTHTHTSKDKFKAQLTLPSLCSKWSLSCLTCQFLATFNYFLFSDEEVRLWMVTQLKALCSWIPPPGEDEARHVKKKVLSSKVSSLSLSQLSRVHITRTHILNFESDIQYIWLNHTIILLLL